MGRASTPKKKRGGVASKRKAISRSKPRESEVPESPLGIEHLWDARVALEREASAEEARAPSLRAHAQLLRDMALIVAALCDVHWHHGTDLSLPLAKPMQWAKEVRRTYAARNRHVRELLARCKSVIPLVYRATEQRRIAIAAMLAGAVDGGRDVLRVTMSVDDARAKIIPLLERYDDPQELARAVLRSVGMTESAARDAVKSAARVQKRRS